MRIDYKNMSIINSNTFHLHDAVFIGFYYNYEKCSIAFEAIEYHNRKKFTFLFSNVFGFMMQSCDFWGKSSRISSWYVPDINERKLIQTILTERKSEDIQNSRIINGRKIVESTLELCSGDTLIIACEYIEFDEVSL